MLPRTGWLHFVFVTLSMLPQKRQNRKATVEWRLDKMANRFGDRLKGTHHILLPRRTPFLDSYLFALEENGHSSQPGYDTGSIRFGGSLVRPVSFGPCCKRRMLPPSGQQALGRCIPTRQARGAWTSAASPCNKRRSCASWWRCPACRPMETGLGSIGSRGKQGPPSKGKSKGCLNVGCETCSRWLAQA